MFGHVFIRTATNDEPLEEFSRAFFERIGVTQVLEGDSTHYIDGIYFVGSAFGIDGRLSYADEEGLPDYLFWLSMQPTHRDDHGAEYLHEHAHSLARFLSTFGWRTFVPDDYCTVAGEHEGTVYLPNSNATGIA